MPKNPEYAFHPVCVAWPEYDDATYQKRLAAYRDHPERADDTAVILAEDAQTWKIADGRHHYLICQELGYACRFEQFAGSLSELIALVTARNGNRRHLDPSQRAMVAARLANMTKADTLKQNMPCFTDAAIAASDKTSRIHAAELLRVSPDSVDRAKKVQRDGVPALVEAVDAGEVSVSAAAEVADLPPEVQEDIVDAGPERVKEAAKEQREQRRAPSYFKPGNNSDPDHRYAELMQKLATLGGQITKAIKEAEAEEPGKSKLFDYLYAHGMIHARDFSSNGKHYGHRFIWFRGLRWLIKLAGLPGKQKTKDQLQKEYDAAMGDEGDE